MTLFISDINFIIGCATIVLSIGLSVAGKIVFKIWKYQQEKDE